MADRRAAAVWQGNLFEGSGQVTLESSGLGTFDVSWPARTEEPGGKTSPEELVAAAHSSCFSMALSNQLAQRDHPAERLEVSAVVTLDKTDAGMTVTRSALTVRGTVPGMDAATFAEAAEAAKTGCPISRMIQGNVDISLDAALA